MQIEPQVIIRGQVFLYRQKAPFVMSGVSVRGALEYDEVEDKIRCHECGEWFGSLAFHLTVKHEMTARDYKIKHGLRLKAALVNEGTRVAMSRNVSATNQAKGGSPTQRNPGLMRRLIEENRLKGKGSRQTAPRYEETNERGVCHAQILDRLNRLAIRLGHTPTVAEMRSNGLSPESIRTRFNVRSIAEVVSLIGLQYDRPPKVTHGKYGRAVLIEILRDFYVEHGRTPLWTDFGRGLLPSRNTFHREFITMKAAYIAAGIGLAATASAAD